MPFEQVLDLRLRTFFALNREGVRLQAKEYREELAIALCPRQDNRYYQQLWDLYNGIAHPEAKVLPTPPPRPAIDAASVEAKNAVISLFARRHIHRGR